MTLPFMLAPVQPGAAIPIWDAGGFRVGEEKVPVLEYSFNDSGWTDDLTSFHEEVSAEHHFIERASRSCALQQLDTFLKGRTDAVVLEIGCSSGITLREIKKSKPDLCLIGADVVRAPLLKLAAELPEVPLFRFDLTHCPLPDNSVDAVVMLNVLEHIEDDGMAMQQIKRILKPGGIVILEVPAGPHLYDAYDKALMHYRRYAAKDLKNLVQAKGFEVVRQTHLGVFVYPGFWWVKKRNQRTLHNKEIVFQNVVEEHIRNTGSSRFLNFVMQAELWLGEKISYPFGIRCLMTCRKSHVE